MITRLFNKKKHQSSTFIQDKISYPFTLEDIIYLLNFGHLIDLDIKNDDQPTRIYRTLTCHNVSFKLIDHQLSIYLLTPATLLYQQDSLNIVISKTSINNKIQKTLKLETSIPFVWPEKNEETLKIEILIQTLRLRISNKISTFNTELTTEFLSLNQSIAIKKVIS